MRCRRTILTPHYVPVSRIVLYLPSPLPPPPILYPRTFLPGAAPCKYATDNQATRFPVMLAVFRLRPSRVSVCMNSSLVGKPLSLCIISFLLLLRKQALVYTISSSSLTSPSHLPPIIIFIFIIRACYLNNVPEKGSIDFGIANTPRRRDNFVVYLIFFLKEMSPLLRFQTSHFNRAGHRNARRLEDIIERRKGL